MSDAVTVARPGPSLLERRFLREAIELGLVALAFLLYFVVRANVVNEPAQALRNSRDLLDFERALGFAWEPALQRWTLESKTAVHVFNYIYFWLDFPLIAVLGLTMYGFRRRQYTFTRDAILSSGALALVIYSLFPAAPPRLLPEAGLIDTLQRFNNLSYQAQSTSFFVNPYAAMPSLHVGWAFLLALGVISAFGTNRFIFVLAVVHPLAQWTSTVVTGNHYIVDGFGGLAVAGLGLSYAFFMDRWGYRFVHARLLPHTG
jgi:hypothetical protein